MYATIFFHWTGKIQILVQILEYSKWKWLDGIDMNNQNASGVICLNWCYVLCWNAGNLLENLPGTCLGDIESNFPGDERSYCFNYYPTASSQ